MSLLEHVVVEKEVLAKDYPSRLASQYELARVYWTDDQRAKGLRLLLTVVSIKRDKFEENHPPRLVSEGMLIDWTSSDH